LFGHKKTQHRLQFVSICTQIAIWTQKPLALKELQLASMRFKWSRSDAMLDLKTIFDPDRMAPAHGSEIRVEDLDPDWRIEWEERAAIMEYDGGLPCERAEAAALAEIAARIQQGERLDEPCCCKSCHSRV
jgi:hypothetical protein